MKRVVRNSAINFASQVITVLVALVCVPITFRGMGTERFGLLTLVWSLLSYAIVFDLGTGPAVARATAASLVSDRGSRIASIVRAGTAIQLGLGLAAAALIGLGAPLLLDLLRVPAVFQPDARLALLALAIAMPVVLVAQSLQGVLEGLERFDLIALVRTPVAAATYAIPAYGAVTDWSLARILFWIVVTRAGALIGMLLMYRASLPQGQTGNLRSELPALFRYGRWLAVSGVLTQLLIYLDRFVLSAMHGLSAVAQYAAPYDAVTKLLVLPGSIGVAMFPGLAKDAARQESSNARASTRASVRLSLAVLVPVSLVLVVLAGPLLRLWLGPGLTDQGVAAFRILLLATLFHAAAFGPVILIEALGRSDVVARYYLIELVLYVPLMILLVTRFGVVGAAWAWVARTAALMLWSHWYANTKC